LTTAQKQDKIADGDIEPAVEAMCTLNKIGAEISALEGVTAITDVTGFGLLGHLGEICEGSNISACVRFDDVPLLPKVKEYWAMDCVPGGTRRNFESYGHNIAQMTPEQQDILCDAQTSGGLLCAVRKESVEAFLALTRKEGLDLKSIGETMVRGEHLIEVL
jgi:selenide,water dikinase